MDSLGVPVVCGEAPVVHRGLVVLGHPSEGRVSEGSLASEVALREHAPRFCVALLGGAYPSEAKRSEAGVVLR